MDERRPVVTKEAFYGLHLDMSRVAYRDLEEQLISLGIILPEKAKMLIRGALFRHSILMVVVQLNQIDTFDFSEILKLTEFDLMEWFARQGGAVLEPIDPSRN